MPNELDGRDPDWAELLYALEHFDVENLGYGINYIRKRYNKSSQNYREVAEALVVTAQRYGVDSDFYKILEEEAVHMYQIQDYTWSETIGMAAYNVDLDGGKNLNKVLELVEFFDIQVDKLHLRKLKKLREKNLRN